MDAGFWSRDGLKPTEPRPRSRTCVVDWLGAARGSTVMVSTDGDIAREKLGNNTPARMVVVGIVDAVQEPVTRGEGASASEQRGAKGARHEARHRSRAHHADSSG